MPFAQPPTFVPPFNVIPHGAQGVQKAFTNPPTATINPTLIQTQSTPLMPPDTYVQQNTAPHTALSGLLNQLGKHTQVLPNGYVAFNHGLIDQIVAAGQQAIEPLSGHFEQLWNNPSGHGLDLLEALYTAQKLAEAGITDASKLYGPVSAWNNTNDPLTQTYLAGFYRAIDEPAAFGPMLAMLVRQSSLGQQQQLPPAQQSIEELGGTVLQYIARYAAKEAVRQVQNLPQPPRHPQQS